MRVLGDIEAIVASVSPWADILATSLLTSALRRRLREIGTGKASAFRQYVRVHFPS